MRRAVFALSILAFLSMQPVGAQERGNGPNPFDVAPSASPSGLVPPSGQATPWRASPYTSRSGVAPLLTPSLLSGTSAETSVSNPSKDQKPDFTSAVEPTKPAERALAKAIVDYSIIGFSILIGALIVFVLLMPTSKTNAAQS